MSFGNEFAWSVVTFGVGNSLSSHTENCKNNFLVLGEGPIDDINCNLCEAEKKFSISFSKAKRKFCLRLLYNDHHSCLFVCWKAINKFNADNKNLNFSTQFRLGSTSSKFDVVDSEEVS